MSTNLKTSVNAELVRELRREVEALVDREDEVYCENFDLADTGILSDEGADDEIIRYFRDNYSSESIGLVELDEIDADTLLSRYGRDAIIKAILDSSTTEPVNYYVQSNEMFSLQCGEYEHQIDVEEGTDLKELIDRATDEELREAGIEDRESFLAYGHPADRFILRLDPIQFLEELSGLVGADTSPDVKEYKNSRPKLSLAHSAPLTMHEILLARVKRARILEAKRKRERNA